jgi:hypothetical protein
MLLTPPAKVQQSAAPTGGDDLTNKTYVDGNFQAKKPAATPGNIAVFGNTPDIGQTVVSPYSIDSNLGNQASNTTLWPSTRLVGSFQYGAAVYKATSSIVLSSSANNKAFSTGSAPMQVAWPNIGSTFALSTGGVATISNSLERTCYYRITFSASSLTDSTNSTGTVECQIRNEDTSTFLTIPKTLKCLANQIFSNHVYLTCLVSVPSAGTLNFSVQLTNIGSNSVTVDPYAPDKDVSILTIERVA